MATKDWVLSKLVVRRRSDYPFHVEGRNAETGGMFLWDVPALGQRYDTSELKEVSFELSYGVYTTIPIDMAEKLMKGLRACEPERE